MSEIERATALIEPVIQAMGFDVVRVAMMGKSRPTLQIMIEPTAARALTVDDCASVSRAVSELLDETDPIGGAYMLEVSSPGIDRPLTRLADYDRFAGCEARIDLERPLESGRKRLQGRLRGTDGTAVRIEPAAEAPKKGKKAAKRGGDAADGGLADKGLADKGLGNEEIRVPFADIRRAKLVLTDELLAAAEKGQH